MIVVFVINGLLFYVREELMMAVDGTESNESAIFRTGQLGWGIARMNPEPTLATVEWAAGVRHPDVDACSR